MKTIFVLPDGTEYQVNNSNICKVLRGKGTFNIICADPPWRYDFSKSDSRKIENQYPTMALEEIKSLLFPIADDAVLLLWATAPKILEGLKVMKTWGFTYKTQAVWDKKNMGMGYWFRGQHEILLVGTRGNFSPPEPENRFSSVIEYRRGQHSKKPKKVYEMIEKMFPDGRYLELFARSTRNGWASWGHIEEEFEQPEIEFI